MAHRKPSILAFSGGGDSRYLLDFLRHAGEDLILAHVNHGTRGKDSERDQEFVEDIARSIGYPCVTARMGVRGGPGSGPGSHPETRRFLPGFEDRARRFRRRFLLELKERSGAGKIVLAHTADDQVETILMRVFEGAGIAGLKGIPRETADGFHRPILHVWREDMEKYLKENRISFRTDRTNRDTRFERNWIRHVLLPLLVKRYGKAVRKRIYTLGERFRELDGYLETMAGNWMRRNIPRGRTDGYVFNRKAFSRLPSLLRVRILQKVCFERLRIEPGERLLTAMDRVVREGGPSARLKVGKGWELSNRYEEIRFAPSAGRRRAAPAAVASGGVSGKTSSGTREGADSRGRGGMAGIVLPGPGEYPLTPFAGHSGASLVVESRHGVTPSIARRRGSPAAGEYFDASGLRLPLAVRPACPGDRIRPFGLHAEKKVKEILIDRKVPREERWGRPVVCDADGEILWIPGVIRSAHAPVTPRTRRTILLRLAPESSRTAKPPPRPRKQKTIPPVLR